jgi:DNA-binding PadR family transcriptional regulator
MRRWGRPHMGLGEDKGDAERGDRHFGWGRLGHRIFGHGDIRYVILALLSKKPSYGYELIKAIEELFSGAYAPSPGLVYPTLTMLVELGYVTAESGDGDKKLYAVTPEGNSFLKANGPIVDMLFGRMAHAAALHKRAESPQIVRAIQNLKLALKLKSSAGELTDKQVQAIADALDAAARSIEQC